MEDERRTTKRHIFYENFAVFSYQAGGRIGGFEEESMRPLSREDRQKIQDLHLRDYNNNFCPQLIDELEVLWRVGRKAEIQQVSQQIEDIITFTYQVSEEREPGFLAKTFLPSKLLHLEHQARNGDQLF